jgi:predicted transcriptional regulator
MKTKQRVKHLNSQTIRTTWETIRAINHDVRQKILQYIIAHPNCYVNNIYKALQLEQSLTSTFLHQLAHVGVVFLDDNGRHVACVANTAMLKKIYQWVDATHHILLDYSEEIHFHFTQKTPDVLSVAEVEVSGVALRNVAQVVKVLHNKPQQQILTLLLERGASSVTDIYILTRSNQGNTSQRLSRLKKMGLVKAKSDGKYIYYHVEAPFIQALDKQIQNFPK